MGATVADQRGGAEGQQAQLWPVCSKLWALAWPLIGRELLAFSKTLIVLSYVGHVLPEQLGALVMAQTLHQSTGTTVLAGLAGAMETFAGQACGAGAYSRVGEVLQQALATTMLCSCGVLALWVWMLHILLSLGQDATVAAAASKCLIALAPALVFEATDQCCRLYLAAQSVVQPAVVTTLTATLLTPIYLHICCKWLQLGLFGVALAWNAVQATSLGLIVICCVLHTGSQPANMCTWPGWTTAAFRGWGQYMRVAVPSCLMLCSEAWSLEVMVMMSGLLPNPAMSISMMSITANLHDVFYRSTTGLGAATGTCIAQSLGGSQPQTARLTVTVGLALGNLYIWGCSCLLLLGRNHVGRLFSNDTPVVLLVAQTIPAMALSLLSEGANTVLSGTLRGCGKQNLGALIGMTYWAVGFPLARWLGFQLHMGGTGLWIGLVGIPTVLQMILNGVIVHFLDWEAEATSAQHRAAMWHKHAHQDGFDSTLPILSSPHNSLTMPGPQSKEQDGSTELLHATELSMNHRRSSMEHPVPHSRPPLDHPVTHRRPSLDHPVTHGPSSVDHPVTHRRPSLDRTVLLMS